MVRFKFSSRGLHHGALSFSGKGQSVNGKRLVSKTNPARSTRAWPAIQINLLNNQMPICSGVAFNNDKWRLYYLLNKEMVVAEMFKICHKCFQTNAYAGNDGPCGRWFSERFSYIVENLKKHHWKNENQPTE